VLCENNEKYQFKAFLDWAYIYIMYNLTGKYSLLQIKVVTVKKSISFYYSNKIFQEKEKR